VTTALSETRHGAEPRDDSEGAYNACVVGESAEVGVANVVRSAGEDGGDDQRGELRVRYLVGERGGEAIQPGRPAGDRLEQCRGDEPRRRARGERDPQQRQPRGGERVFDGERLARPASLCNTAIAPASTASATARWASR
jgi:hypothetical protein